MRRTGRSALAQGVMALAVMAAGVVVVATDGSTPVANAQTRLEHVVGATVVSSSGAVRGAVSDMSLNHGDVVTTGPDGAAWLVTRGRVTMLGNSAAIAVVNGGRQQLRAGTAVVDAQAGPGLDLDLSGTVVAIPHGSATEAARSVSVRVGALSGSASLTGTTGRRLPIPELSQAVLSGDALPGGTTPLRLTDSADEARAVPHLVADDIALKTLARGIDTTGRSTARVVKASWTGMTQPVPDRVSRSERVLPMLIADATSGGTAQQRYNNAVAWRAQGGSWGVVLHLLSGRATAVESTLAALQRSGQSPGQIGTVPSTVVAGAEPTGPSSFQTPPANGGGNHPPRSHPHQPSGTPSSSSGPDTVLGSLVATVQTVIDSVFGLLPHGKKNASDPATTRVPDTTAHKAATGATSVVAPRTSAVEKPTAKSPAATSKPSSGLLSNVLGGLISRH